MKGLLIKDLYMMKKYCRAYLFIAVIFIAVSIISNENMFFIFYPCLLSGMIPVNLLGYDERSRWVQYSAALPYTKAQIVSGKYIIGLLSQLAVLFLTSTAQAVKMLVLGNFVLGDFILLMLIILTVSTVAPSFTLPFIFKFGVEKGRMAYYVMIGFVCGASVLASALFKDKLTSDIKSNLLFAVFAAVGIILYIFSWYYLSVVFYKKREIQ